ncbi:hypothetical protein L3V82_08000 [Thiotrichales bacterium 19S3-7]|nr:hypothetical protein [Thiotrichales bacterium 19S3-7]MCF6802102.1 hypothetical protein [Thiotrichales bacterium 19S3-11]
MLDKTTKNTTKNLNNVINNKFKDLFQAYNDHHKDYTLTRISYFDHWLTLEEAEILLPYWSHKLSTNELLHDCINRCIILSKFLSQFTNQLEIYTFKYHHRKNSMNKSSFSIKEFTSENSKANYLEYDDYSESYNPQVPFITRSFSFIEKQIQPPPFKWIKILLPKYECIITNNDDYTIHFLHHKNNTQLKTRINQIATSFNLYNLV